MSHRCLGGGRCFVLDVSFVTNKHFYAHKTSNNPCVPSQPRSVKASMDFPLLANKPASCQRTNESPTASIQRVLTKFEFQQITAAQITKVVQRLVNRKATGIHNIPNKVLKDSVHLIAPVLMDIFNLSIISTKIFPDDLKVFKAVPVYKSGERENLIITDQ